MSRVTISLTDSGTGVRIETEFDPPAGTDDEMTPAQSAAFIMLTAIADEGAILDEEEDEEEDYADDHPEA